MPRIKLNLQFSPVQFEDIEQDLVIPEQPARFISWINPRGNSVKKGLGHNAGNERVPKLQLFRFIPQIVVHGRNTLDTFPFTEIPPVQFSRSPWFQKFLGIKTGAN